MQKHEQVFHNLIIVNQMPFSYPSIQSLFIEMLNDGSLAATGTGFIMKSASETPYLITNRHNVTGRNSLTGDLLPPYSPPNAIRIHYLINKSSQDGLDLIRGGLLWQPRTESLYGEGGDRLWCEHPMLGATADFVALPLNQAGDIEHRPYSVQSIPLALAPSSMVNIIGFPFGASAGGLLPIWTAGFIASEIDFDYNGLPQFLLDSRTRQGQSGSPVVCHVNGIVQDKNGVSSALYNGQTFFLGIYSGRINAESDIGIVWKASAIQELIETLS